MLNFGRKIVNFSNEQHLEHYNDYKMEGVSC